MMLIKSFFRKKTIRNYLVIFFLTFTCIFTCFVVKNFYTEEYNKLNRASFIAIKNPPMDMKDIINDNIKDIVEGIELDEIYRIDNELGDNETIAPRDILWFPKREKYVVGDIHDIEKANLQLEIKKVSEDIGYFLVNEKNYQKIKNSGAFKTYIITLKNYLIQIETEGQIHDMFPEEFIYYRDYNVSPKDYSGRISTLNFFMVVCAILFGIVFIITLINIIIDEQKTNKLYYVIGYNRTKIFLIFISKVLCLLLVPLLLSFLLASIIGIILRFI